MTPLQNYADLINSVFGPNTSSFDTSKNLTNNVIGALNSLDNYSKFKANFRARLERLNKVYSTPDSSRTDMLVQVNEVANIKNWQGAYAELAAFDYLNSDNVSNKYILHDPIQPNITINSTRTFGDQLGKKNANLDGYIKDVNLYFDVKCLKDNSKEIFSGIFKELESHLGLEKLVITPTYKKDISYGIYQKHRKQLLQELKDNVSVVSKTKYVKSKVIKNLSYQIMWDAGVQTTEYTYNPYVHAENLYSSVFNYANKFVKDSPSVIALVTFPWYNNTITDFVDSNKKFYRAFARRVFCQHIHDSTKFTSFEPSFQGTETIYEVSQHLSGIIFLEDDCIESTNPNSYNVKSYTYLNPNSKHKILPSRTHLFITNCMRNSEYDNFENDNY